MRAKVEILLLALALVLAGCPKAPKEGAQEIADIDKKRYPKTLDRFTSSSRVYEDLDTKLLVTATYRSWSFRDAYIDEVSRRAVKPRIERKAMKNEERKNWEIYHSFVITAYTRETKHNDLRKSAKIWELRLYDHTGRFTTPVVVKRLDVTDKTLDTFFPTHEWGRTYLVKFPREQLETDTPKLTLQIAGALGVAEMGYDLSGEPDPEPPAMEATGPSGEDKDDETPKPSGGDREDEVPTER